jgi:hypothetical protein
MMLYRIFTEAADNLEQYQAVLDVVRAQFDGFTVIPAIGYYKGKREHSVIIEISVSPYPILTSLSSVTINHVAREIKRVNKQESVMVQEIQDETYFV